MTQPKLFQYAVLYHPTKKEANDDGAKSKVIIEPKTVLAEDINKANMMAVMEIPQEYKDKLDQVEVAIRPF